MSSIKNLNTGAIMSRRSRWNKFLFAEALAYMKEMGGNAIVEIGTIRDTTDAGRQADGWSTYVWAESGHRVWSVDVDNLALNRAKKLVAAVGCVNFIKSDGVAFLKRFARDIDLLYIDGPNGGQFGLNALGAAQMARSSIILIDDCDLPVNKHKGLLLIPMALKMGYRMANTNGRQVLLTRGAGE